MANYAERLFAQVDQESACLERLLRVVDEERKVLTSGSHTELFATSEKKVALSRELEQLQTQRRKLIAAMNPGVRMQMGLMDAAMALPKDQRGRFRGVVKKAQGLAKRLQDANEANKRYLTEALDTVEHVVGIMTGRIDNRSYGKRPPQGPQKARLLAREV